MYNEYFLTGYVGLYSHARAVIATLGGQHGAAGRAHKWRHLYAGFTIWLSQTDATGTILIFPLLLCLPSYV